MNPSLLRLLDANCNRAREALRVIEDYARFVLNDAPMCAQLKELRHDFASATRAFADDAILHRDTPGDVGTGIKTESERSRDDVSHVVIASGKRLGEALRTIEEFLKTENPTSASKIESVRYRFYEVEKQIARSLPAVACVFASVRLYVLITESLCKKPWVQVVEESIAGGADCLQLREKDLDAKQLLDRARKFVELCKKGGAISIINDRPDIAMLSNADGVHVGQDDLPVTEVRKLVGQSKIVGVSTHNIEQARQALRDGASYVGVGPVFKSATKPRDFLPGLPFAQQVAQELQDKIPAVAIAGINEANVDEVLATGIKAIAVSSAVIGGDNVRGAAGKLRDKLAADARR